MARRDPRPVWIEYVSESPDGTLTAHIWSGRNKAAAEIVQLVLAGNIIQHVRIYSSGTTELMDTNVFVGAYYQNDQQ